MTYQCQLLDRPAQPTLVIRTRASVQMMPQILGQAWGAILQHSGRSGVHPAGPPFVASTTWTCRTLILRSGSPLFSH